MQGEGEGKREGMGREGEEGEGGWEWLGESARQKLRQCDNRRLVRE